MSRGKQSGKLKADAVSAAPGHEYDAELRDWGFKRAGECQVAFGRVYGDQKRRWPNGYVIATSAVKRGSRKEGDVITTANTRYLLAGPPGDLDTMLELARHMAANGERRQRVWQDERLFDLLPAAWGMDDTTFEKVTGLPPRWLWQWRNHYRAPTDEELARVRRLMSFHEAIRLTYAAPNYAGWWRRRWHGGSLIGSKSPLEAVLEEGDAVLDVLERSFRSQAGW